MTLKLGSSSSNYLEFSVAIVVCFSAQTSMGSPSGFDRTRNVEIGNKNIKLQHLEEAYTTANWLVRIYRLAHLKEL